MSTNNGKMEGFFKLLWHGQNQISSKVYVANKGQEDIKGLVKIKPSNKMEGQITLRQPPIITEEFTPVKDTYANEKIPRLNYGKANILKVGTDKDGKRYRSFMDFDISTLPRNMYIATATLELTSYDDEKFKYFELSTAKKEYEEYGLTWSNQTLRENLIDVSNLDGDKKVYKFDVTKVISEEWYGKNFKNHGFILKGYNENIQQVKDFCSKESFNSPKLVIQYMDLATYEYGGAKLDCNIKVRRHENDKGIKGSVQVHRYDDFNYMKAKVHVQNKEMLEGKLFVSKERIKCKVKVKESYTLKSKVTVRAEGEPILFEGKVFVNQAKFYGNFNIRETNTIKSKVNVTRRKLKSKVLVKAQKQINGKVVIIKNRFNTLKAKVRVNGNTFKGNVNVKTNNTLKAKTEVIIRYRNDTKGLVTVSQEKLKCSVDVINHNSLHSNVKVKQINLLKAKVRVAEKGWKTIKGHLKVKATNHVKGHVQVNSQFMHSNVKIRGRQDIICRLLAKTNNDLKANVRIVYRNDIRSKVTIKEKGFNDLECNVKVNATSSGINRNYAFIL